MCAITVNQAKAQEAQVVKETPVAQTTQTEDKAKAPTVLNAKEDGMTVAKATPPERPELATRGIVADGLHDGASAKLAQAEKVEQTEEPKKETVVEQGEAKTEEKTEVVEGEKKEEGGFWNGVKNGVKSALSSSKVRGALVGAGVGLAAELIHGDKDASLLERAGNVFLSAANGYTTDKFLGDKMEEAGVSKVGNVLSQAAGDFAWAWQNSGSSASFVGKLADLGVTTGVKWGAGKAFEAIANRTDNPTIRALAGVGLTIGSNWLGGKIGTKTGEWLDKKLGMGDIGKEKRTLEARDDFKKSYEGKPQGYEFWKGYTEKEIAHLEAKAKIKRGDERKELEETAKALRANLKSVNSESVFNAIHGDKTQLARLQAGKKVDISSIKTEKVEKVTSAGSSGNFGSVAEFARSFAQKTGCSIEQVTSKISDWYNNGKSWWLQNENHGGANGIGPNVVAFLRAVDANPSLREEIKAMPVTQGGMGEAKDTLARDLATTFA